MSDKAKTLLILSPGFPGDETDITCIPPQQQFVKALRGTYPRVNIVVLAFQYPFFTREYNWHGVKVIAFGGKSKGQLFRLRTWIRVWIRLNKLYKEFEVIGLLSFWLGECAFVAHYFSKLKGLKHYCWLLGQDAKAGNKYVNRTNPKGKELIALSDFIQREFSRNYKITPQHIIPVGITPDLFGVGKQERLVTIMGAGSLIPLKQYHLFIEIISWLRLSYPDVNAVICGDGPEMSRLKAMVKSLNLQNNILLRGELPHDQVLALMQQSKIFLHTSEYEGFGAVCLEALYAGASVISFVKPMDAAIKNWYSVNSLDEMLEKTEQILNDKSLTYDAVLPFKIGDNAKKMMELFGYNDEAI